MAKILVAGHPPCAAAVVVAELACAGHEVIRVGHGGRALGVLDLEAVDLILSDLDMPHLDGIGLAELAGAKVPRPAYILLVTGDWTRALDDRAVEAGIDSRFLASTLDAADLRREVDRLLGHAAVDRAQGRPRMQAGLTSLAGTPA